MEWQRKLEPLPSTSPFPLTFLLLPHPRKENALEKQIKGEKTRSNCAVKYKRCGNFNQGNRSTLKTVTREPSSPSLLLFFPDADVEGYIGFYEGSKSAIIYVLHIHDTIFSPTDSSGLLKIICRNFHIQVQLYK